MFVVQEMIHCPLYPATESHRLDGVLVNMGKVERIVSIGTGGIDDEDTMVFGGTLQNSTELIVLNMGSEFVVYRLIVLLRNGR